VAKLPLLTADVAAATPANSRTNPPAVANRDAVPPYEPALQLIAEFEGFVDHAYPDPASGGEPWTIGYGFTSIDGRPVQPGDTLSRAEADAQLLSGVNACARHLANRVPYWSAMANDQRCALISFAWNLGEDFYGGAGFDTISRRLREKDWAAVPEALLLYCDPGSSVQAGLLRRRQAETDLWKKGMSLPNVSSLPLATLPTAITTPANSPVLVTGGSKRNPLNVPWFDQLAMDDGQGWRDCFSASSAMLAAYWGKEPNEDDYNALRQQYGDSTTSEAQLAALRHLGLKAEFRTDGTLQTIKSEIDAGRPVAVGWLINGPPSAPSGGGHWTVVIGYDASSVIMNDPYGSCDLVNGGYPANHNGAHQHYSYANWEPRWRPQGSGGWYLVTQR
jgi:GH24 family phage-related lysozyme (muramidase)